MKLIEKQNTFLLIVVKFYFFLLIWLLIVIKTEYPLSKIEMKKGLEGASSII